MRSAAIVTIVSLLIYAAAVGFPDPGNIDECDADRLGEAFGPLRTIYTVDEGALSGVCHGTDDTTVYEAWTSLTAFTTAEERAPIVGFAGFDNTSGADVAAFAVALDRSQSRFLIAVNREMVQLRPRQVRRVVGHEFAHVLTGTAQGIDRAQGEDCGTRDAGYGCITNNNYLSLWVDEFWPETELASLQQDGYRNETAAARRCSTDPGFPSLYAATNPSEDFAESFEFFLYGNRVAANVRPRIEFLSTFPQLVRMRDRIAALGLSDTRLYQHDCSVENRPR